MIITFDNFWHVFKSLGLILGKSRLPPTPARYAITLQQASQSTVGTQITLQKKLK